MSAGAANDGAWSPPGLLMPVLLPLAWLYESGLEVYLAPYKLGIRQRYRLPCRVASVGNLTFGGTGKSPMVRAVCEHLLQSGLRPAVLSRGHGGSMCLNGGIVSDGDKRLVTAVESGDEPAFLADVLRGVPVAVGKDRRKSGRLLIEQFNPDIIVLDDGMQYWQLHRDAEAVLVSAAAPFGNGLVLPAGTLREPIRGISRADAVVITGIEEVQRDYALGMAEQMLLRAPGAEVFLAERKISGVLEPATGEKYPCSMLQSIKVVAVSGIANPASFEVSLAANGADVVASLRFGDHCPYDEAQRTSILEEVTRTGADAVVTTAKDAVKLTLTCRTLVLDMEMVVEKMDRLLEIIAGKVRRRGLE